MKWFRCAEGVREAFRSGAIPVTHHYRDVRDGEWIQPTTCGHKMACCDCGLVHTMDFRIKDGHIQFRAVRNNRSTAQRRRYMGSIDVTHRRFS